jgi:uncharacterized protein YfaS (alpha-2-macroglobulin family)
MNRIRLAIGTLIATPLLLLVMGADTPDESLANLRQKAEKLTRDGNHKEACDRYQKLTLDPEGTPALVGNDLSQAIACLNRLNRTKENDAFREKVINVHSNNWRLLYAAARSYFNEQHYGTIIAGEFQRGPHRGGDGKWVNSFERDRLRALQLMVRAMENGEGGARTEAGQAGKTDNPELAEFYLEFARMLMGYSGYGESWRLQYLSDLSQLPDYDEGYRHYGSGDNRAAPVDEGGNPIYHKVPRRWEEATSDGQRWRWMISRAMELSPAHANRGLMELANFFHQQFDVQTMADYGSLFDEPEGDSDKKDESGPFAVHTLKENETIARLATGIKRFTLPAEFNFIGIYQKIADGSKESGWGEQALNQLAQIFENRRQYDRAVEFWNLSIKGFGPGHDNWKQKRIDQIVKNWGQFENIGTFPAGKDATIEFRFRNGKKVMLVAQEVNVTKILSDIKDYLKSNPSQLDWNRMNIANIGWMLIQKDQAKYVGKEVANWTLDLLPREKHFDRRITVKTPLSKAGAYMLTATMADGNTSKVVIWINDTVLVKKQLDKKAYFFVADAVTGKPLPKINVEFFGYRQEWRQLTKHYDVLTTAFAENSDEVGQVMPSQNEFSSNYQWLISATSPSTRSGQAEGRLAYLGFTGIWYSDYYDHEYNQAKVFTITDRPVYRPNQPVKFKFWVRHAKYDQEDTSSFANRSFQLELHNPKGDKIFEKQFTADDFGGFDGEYALPGDAALGVYSINIRGMGGSTFRVEEYKKPEFEVNVEAPTEPVMLGEKITATIKAKYYFGAPVTQAKAKYKILRSSYSANWYPICYWDWFYGPGYWWFACDYPWYPGWREWGCKRPHFWWWPAVHQPPEVVAEAEVPVGADGTVKVDIDTAIAKMVHGDTDHRYEITAEVTDNSRRTIVGQGVVLVARKPFKVYAWVDRGHYRVGDVIEANFSAQTLDNKPVKGKGTLLFSKVTYRQEKDNVVPSENPIHEWDLDTDDEGKAHVQIKASEAGQYRLSYKVTDTKKHVIEGGYVLNIMGRGTGEKDFKFNAIELIQDQKEYRPGDKVRLMINTDRPDSTVVLFLRPANGICLQPEIIPIKGKSTVKEIEVTKKDMPNFFVEAFTVSDGKRYSEMKEIIVPPEKRVLNVEAIPSSTTYKPGQKATVKVKLTDILGKPFVGSTVMTVYDKSVEYISGGSNVPEIKAFFWKWRRQHHPQTECSLDRYFGNLILPGDIPMQNIGVFGYSIADEEMEQREENGAYEKRAQRASGMKAKGGGMLRQEFKMVAGMARSDSLALAEPAAPSLAMADDKAEAVETEGGIGGSEEGAESTGVQPTVRKNFADTAFWIASLTTDKDGIAQVEFPMPESLTTWRIKTWAMGHGTVVGEAASDVVTTKSLLLRLQAPRFFVEKDEVVLSANIHNYLKNAKKVNAILELEGGCLEVIGTPTQSVEVEASGEKRVDWRVKVVKEGEAVVRMKAITDEESDAMEMRFPSYVHGMLKTESYCGVIRPNGDKATFTINVPAERRIEQSMLEMRYSPTLAGAMVDALPYLVEYPYGCTEQTLNRFLPTVITQKILRDMGLNLKAIQEKRTNLNAQEIGDDQKRSEDWKRSTGEYRWDGNGWVPRNPVFDAEEVADMVKQGLKALTAMQLSDGGWGWFSGWGEYSYPHTTAYVVHGLQIAQQNDVAIVPGVLDRGIAWLERYQAGEVEKLKNYPSKTDPWKAKADDLDAFVYMVLVDAKKDDTAMGEFLYRDRVDLSVYAKAMFGLALQKTGQKEKLNMILRNIEQFLVQDDENQTAYLNLGNQGYWWYWYGSENEAHAYYLKLLSLTEPKGEKASRLVKYLLNNRKHASYWNSTRDTALCIEAMADYLRASGEDKPDMTVEIYVDGQKKKEVKINADNIFSFDNKLLISGKAVESGKHTIEVRRKGTGPVYFNAYLTNFTLEDFITKAGLEIKVNRQYYKLTAVDKTIKVSGSRGQALDQKVEKYERKELANLASLKSGDLVEIELEIDSKNDYEYIIFEDMKASGFEPVEVRSGYNGNDLGAYVEFRDERVCFFSRLLARGKHSVSYRLRAEIPGKFSALPTKASAMYAPELKANSDEIKLSIED